MAYRLDRPQSLTPGVDADPPAVMRARCVRGAAPAIIETANAPGLGVTVVYGYRVLVDGYDRTRHGYVWSPVARAMVPVRRVGWHLWTEVEPAAPPGPPGWWERPDRSGPAPVPLEERGPRAQPPPLARLVVNALWEPLRRGAWRYPSASALDPHRLPEEPRKLAAAGSSPRAAAAGHYARGSVRPPLAQAPAFAAIFGARAQVGLYPSWSPEADARLGVIVAEVPPDARADLRSPLAVALYRASFDAALGRLSAGDRASVLAALDPRLSVPEPYVWRRAKRRRGGRKRTQWLLWRRDDPALTPEVVAFMRWLVGLAFVLVAPCRPRSLAPQGVNVQDSDGVYAVQDGANASQSRPCAEAPSAILRVYRSVKPNVLTT